MVAFLSVPPLVGFGVVNPPVSVTYNGTIDTGTTSAVGTGSFGAEAPGRIVVLISHGRAGTPGGSGVFRIGGIDATKIISITGPDTFFTMGYLVLPTGTSGQVAASYPGQSLRTNNYMSTFSIYGASSPIPVGVNSIGGGTTSGRGLTFSTDVLSGGCVIGAQSGINSVPGNWTGIVEQYNGVVSTSRCSGGSVVVSASGVFEAITTGKIGGIASWR